MVAESLSGFFFFLSFFLSFNFFSSNLYFVPRIFLSHSDTQLHTFHFSLLDKTSFDALFSWLSITVSEEADRCQAFMSGWSWTAKTM